MRDRLLRGDNRLGGGAGTPSALRYELDKTHLDDDILRIKMVMHNQHSEADGCRQSAAAISRVPSPPRRAFHLFNVAAS